MREDEGGVRNEQRATRNAQRTTHIARRAEVSRQWAEFCLKFRNQMHHYHKFLALRVASCAVQVTWYSMRVAQSGMQHIFEHMGRIKDSDPRRTTTGKSLPVKKVRKSLPASSVRGM